MDLNKVQFQFHETTPDRDMWGNSHAITAHQGGQQVGEIHWKKYNPGHVEWLSTRNNQRQGLGTALWDRASEVAAEHGLQMPSHSPVKLPKGKNWVAKEEARDVPRPIPGQQPLIPRKGRNKTKGI